MMMQMIDRWITLFFTILTGIATTGTFIFMLSDRKPHCKIKVRFIKVDMPDSIKPDIVITLTNTGKTNLHIHAVWITSPKMEQPYYAGGTAYQSDYFGIIEPKRMKDRRVSLEKVLPLFKKDTPKGAPLSFHVKVVLETGERFHSKKTPIPPELIELTSKLK